MQPQRKVRPVILCAALVAAVAVVAAAHRCVTAFLVPVGSGAPPVQPQQSVLTPHGNVLADQVNEEGGNGAVLSGMLLAGVQANERDVNVAMYNKKRGRRDRSEGWTNRKKFRTCSTMARAATVKGRKILRRQMLRGKKHPSPGDYINHKMQPTKALR
mmetsp:Transcript_102939/g.286652  ORF Transcript_102939/g.286652 Transcript_102939/m.286652 type:complete len:158 (-) Transcript_102939:75-548(-)